MTDIKRPVPLYIAVITHDAATGEIEQQRIIDHNRHEDRVWLGKHCFWAVRNRRAVTTVPVKNHDSELPEWV